MSALMQITAATYASPWWKGFQGEKGRKINSPQWMHLWVMTRFYVLLDTVPKAQRLWTLKLSISTGLPPRWWTYIQRALWSHPNLQHSSPCRHPVPEQTGKSMTVTGFWIQIVGRRTCFHGTWRSRPFIAAAKHTGRSCSHKNRERRY